MVTPDKTHTDAGKSPFLLQPGQLSELDNWLDEYLRSKGRFTFSEEDVLRPVWETGEEVRLREDSRFKKVGFFPKSGETQWQLTEHSLANQMLHELMLDEQWDGHDLLQRLENLDQASNDSVFHIFCPADDRFRLSQDEQGLYNLTLSADDVMVEFTSEQKRIIDQLAPQLLSLWPDQRTEPWTTSSLLEELKRLSGLSEPLEHAVPAALEHWLLRQEAWVRVGVDSWIPKRKLPSIPARHRYAVMPVFSAGEGDAIMLPSMKEDEDLENADFQGVERPADERDHNLSDKFVRWRVILRVHHINEGTVPVPKQARPLYPYARRLAVIVAIPGLWFADEHFMTVWLDRTKNRLFGEDIQNQFAFLEAGEILEVEWTTVGLVFRTLGVDSNVAEEEARLIDLAYLSQLRSSALESYRVSLRAIMNADQKALSFQELYEQLCNRQRHKPNRSSIRAILSSSPEFVFIGEEQKWALNPEVAPEEGAKLLRRSIAVAKNLEDNSTRLRQESMSLPVMIAKSREQITALRSLYLSTENSKELERS